MKTGEAIPALKDGIINTSYIFLRSSSDEVPTTQMVNIGKSTPKKARSHPQTEDDLVEKTDEEEKE